MKLNGVPFLILQDADRAALAGGAEVDSAGSGGEDSVVAAEAGALAGPEAGAALADDDLAAGHLLAGEDLDPEHVRVGFAAVAARAEAFLMRHLRPRLSRWVFCQRLFSPLSVLPRLFSRRRRV